MRRSWRGLSRPLQGSGRMVGWFSQGLRRWADIWSAPRWGLCLSGRGRDGKRVGAIRTAVESTTARSAEAFPSPCQGSRYNRFDTWGSALVRSIVTV